MDNIAELERRITAALSRIGAGVESLSAAASSAREAPVATLADGVAEAEIARLNEALDEEQMLTAQLNERLRVVRAQEASRREALEAEVARLVQALDSQGEEVARLSLALGTQAEEAAQLSRTVGSLRDQLHLMSEALAEGQIDPQLIDQAMQTELEALRVQRAAETAELTALIAALDPLTARLEQETTDA